MCPLTEEEEHISRGVRPVRTTNFTAGDFRGFASPRDSGPSLESRSQIRPHSGAAYLQACLRHAEERQGAEDRDFGWDFGIIDGMARSCEGSEPGWVRLPERGAGYDLCPQTSLATEHASETGGYRPGVGNISGAPKDECQSVKEGRHRSEGGIRSAGPRAGCELGGLYKVGPGAEASSRQQTRSRRASTTTARKRANFGKPGLME